MFFPVRARAEAARMIAAFVGITLRETDCEGYFGCDLLTAKTRGKLPFGQLQLFKSSKNLW